MKALYQMLTVLLICGFSALGVQAQLSGVVTIGPGGTYTTIGDFMTAFNAGGMNGNLTVRFLTNANPYGGQMFFNTPTLKNASDTLIIESQSGDPDDVILGSNFGTAANVALLFFGTNFDNTIVRNLTIVHQNNGTGIAGIRFDNCSNITIENNLIQLVQTTPNGFGILGFRNNGLPLQNIRIRNNFVIGGNTRVSLQITGAATNISNAVIAQNLLRGSITGTFAGNGIFLTGSTNSQLIDSRIDSNDVIRNGIDGIQIGTLRNLNVSVSNNFIDTASQYGIRFPISASVGGSNLRINNNVIVDCAYGAAPNGSSQTGGGIYLQPNGLDSLTITGNYVNRRSPTLTTFYGVWVQTLTNPITNTTVRNNIVGQEVGTVVPRLRTHGTFYGIYFNNFRHDNTVINSNTIRIDSSGTTNYPIWNGVAAENLTMDSNTVEVRHAQGLVYSLYSSGNPVNGLSVSRNNIKVDSSFSTNYCVFVSGLTNNSNVDHNNIEIIRNNSTFGGIYFSGTHSEGTSNFNRVIGQIGTSSWFGHYNFAAMTNFQVNNNYFYLDSSSSTFYGIYHSSASANDNVFEADTILQPKRIDNNTGTSWGIFMGNNPGTYLLRNYVVMNRGDGIYLSATRNSSSRRALVANNMVSIGAANASPTAGTIPYGITMSNCQNVDIVHNSININSPRTLGAGLRTFSSTSGFGCRIYNNSFVNASVGTGTYYVADLQNNWDAMFAESNHNNFFSATTALPFRAVINGTTQTTNLAGVQAGTPFEQNSLGINPGYLAFDNLRVSPTGTGARLNGNARFFPEVPVDIDSNARAGAPDIGCFEFTATGLDAGISVINPTAPLLSDTVVVLIGNARTTAITSVALSYAVDGDVVDETFAVDIAAGGSQEVRFAQLLNLTGTSEFEVYIRTVNGTVDAEQNNDTVRMEITPALSGIYTIDPDGTGDRNFETIQEALSTAQRIGVSASVTFNIAAGTYNQTANTTVFPIPGASAERSITFRSANGNPTSVVYQTSNAQRLFDFLGVSHVHFKDLTLQGLSTHLFYNVFLTGCTDMEFDNVRFLNPPFTSGSTRYAFYMTGCNEIKLTNSHIEGGNWGIYGLTNTNNVLIENCDLINIGGQNGNTSFGYPVYFSSVSNGRVINNRFDQTDITAGFYAVYALGTINEPNIIDGNIVKGSEDETSTGTRYALWTSATVNDPDNPSIVSNNIVYGMRGLGTTYGIYHSAANGIRIYNNLVMVEERTSDATTILGGIYVQGSVNAGRIAEVYNNISIVDGDFDRRKVGILLSLNASNRPTLNGNLYHFIGSGDNYVLGQRGTAVAATDTAHTIARWRTMTTQEALSVQADPQLQGTAPNFSLTRFSPVARAGVNVLDFVPTDINGNARSTTFDIGPFVSPATAFPNRDIIDFGNTGRQLTETFAIGNSSAADPAPVTNWTFTNLSDFTVTPVPPASFELTPGQAANLTVGFGVQGQTSLGRSDAEFNLNSAGVQSQVRITGQYAALTAVDNLVPEFNLFEEIYNYGVTLPGGGARVLTARLAPTLPLTAAKSIIITNMEIVNDAEELFSLTNVPATVSGNTFVGIAFTPPTVGGFGRKTAQVVITHTGFGSPDTIKLEANVGVPQIDIPSSVLLNSVTVGETRYTSQFDNVTLVRIGKVGEVDPIIFVPPVFVDGGEQFEIIGNGGNFFITNTADLTNPANWSSIAEFSPTQQQFHIAVRIKEPATTTQPGGYSGTMRIAEAVPASSTLLSDVFLSFVGQIQPADPNTAEVFPLIVNFGDVPTTQVAERSITLRNFSQTAKTVSLALQVDPVASFYSFGERSVTKEVTIPAGQSVRVPVFFAPTAAGERQAMLAISGGITSTVALQARGTAFAPPVDTGRVFLTYLGNEISATSVIDFGTVNVGGGESVVVHLHNTTREDINLNGISRSGNNPSQFLLQWSPMVVAGGTAVPVSVSFAPSSETPSLKTGVVTFITSSGARSFQVRGEAVSTGGTGVGGSLGRVFFERASVNIGSAVVGGTVTGTNTLINERSMPIHLDTILIIGAFGSQEFQVVNGGGSGHLPGSASRQVAFNFTPVGTTGQRNATLVAVAQGGDLIRTATISGRAVLGSGRATLSADGALEILGSFPNPANLNSTVSYRLNAPAQRIALRLYDATGRVVGEGEQTALRSGEHTYTFDVSGLPSGGYFFIIEADGKQVSAPLRIVR